MNITLGGTSLPTKNQKIVQAYDLLTKDQRTADGTLHSDIIARKHKFSISHSSLSGTDYDTLNTLYETDGPFTMVYTDWDGEQSISVIITSLKADFFKTYSGGEIIMHNISYILEEI